MEQQNIPWGPVAVAALAVVLLNMIGMVWIGVSQERSRADIARLGQQFREIPAAPAQPDASPELAAIQKRLDTLATKLDSLAPNAEDAKAVARLAAEVKNLSNRVEALAAAKSAPAKTPQPARPRPLIEQDEPPRPFYGPGYPAWPTY